MVKGRDKASQKYTLTEKAYNAIKNGILCNELEEGSFLSQADVMRRYGIGRTPFREACNRLHHEQLLEVVPRRGYLVSEISFRSVREIFEVRVILEGVSAELAALRASQENIHELEEIARRSWSFADSDSRHRELVRTNTEFHHCIARMGHNRELLRLITGLLERMERLSYLELRSRTVTRTDTRSLHKPILDAIKQRRPVAAREAMLQDIMQGQIDILGTRDQKPGHLLSNDSSENANSGTSQIR
jgi:DNA-binding GntR family transcriptional regulator